MNQPSASGVRPRGPAPGRSSSADRAYLILQVLLRLGPGPHTLAEVIAKTGLPRSTAHRILQSGIRAGTFWQPTYGYYEVASPNSLTALPGGSPTIKAELAQLQRRTGQVAVWHSHVLLDDEARICVDIAHGSRTDFAAALSPQAGAALRQAPLHQDAAGLVILANLGETPDPSGTLSRIRTRGHAITPAPLPGWSMLSAPLWRGNVPVGSVSLLTPESHLAHQAERMTDVTMDAAAAISRDLDQSHTHRQPLAALAQAS